MVDPNGPCIEALLLGTQLKGPAKLGGNFRIRNEGQFTYDSFVIVEVTIPEDAAGKPAYKVREDHDMNGYDGDVFDGLEDDGVTVRFEPDAIDDPTPPNMPWKQQIAYACAGPHYTVDSSNNPSLARNGGSPYEGMVKHRCNAKVRELD